MHQVNIYNTLGRKKEEFKPIKTGEVLMYHCGPTVYWTQHLGNMRAMVLADLIVRSFEYIGYQVKLTRNYTDVGHLTSDGDEGEDKMETSAKKEKLDPAQIANKYIKVFENDIHALNITDPEFKPRATEIIQDMIRTIQILIDKGYAYQTDLAIYFDVSQAKNYTKLSGQKIEEQFKDAGKAQVSDINKKQPTDFALWFFKAGKHKNALQYWPSPFISPLVANGEGFPGWHLECSVMANKFLGGTIDVHMGGVEHIPIHHTNEIAQSEAVNGVKFVNYWLHNEHLLVNNGKMSKSEGTSYTLQDIIDKGFNPLALRYFFCQAHYRSKQNFTWEALDGAQTALDRLYTFIQNKPIKEFNTHEEEKNRIHKRNLVLINNYKKEFLTYISDNFNIPAALALIWEIVKDNLLPHSEKKKLILDFDKVLGLNLNKLKQEKIIIPAEVNKLAEARILAKDNKDWAKADELRNKIAELGFTIEDSENDFILKKK